MRLNRLPVALALAGLASFGCKSTSAPPTPVPTSIGVSVTTVDIAALGASAAVTATVRDQDGNAMSGQTVTWASTNTGVATVTGSAAGTIIGVANGATTVTATSGSLSAQVAVNVTQVTSQIVKISGDTQAGIVGQALGQPLVVEQRDSRGNPVPGGTGDLLGNTVVTFAVASGGGNLGGTVANVGPDGRASTTWTLGNTAGAQTVTATAGVATAGTVTFSATATPAPADSVRKVSGDAQMGPASQTLTDSIVVQVLDQFGNAFAGQSVSFAATTGGGSVSSATVTTDAGGRAGVRWTLGSAAGAQTATATAGSLKGSPLTFTATAIAPDSLGTVSGDGQSGAVNGTLPDSIIVRVLDQFGNPFAGQKVAFAASGGGSVSSDTVVSGAAGRAGVRWTLGPTAGAQTATATAAGVPKGSPRTFTATAVLQVATTLVKVAGDGLTGLVGKRTNIPPAVRVDDQVGNPMTGISVTFTVTGGGGTVQGGGSVNAISDANGLAAPADWTIGGTAGANTLQASSGALTPVSFSVTGQVAAFDIVVRLYGDTTKFTAGARAAFTGAETRWESLIFGDIQSVAVDRAAGAIPCDTTLPAITETVDDVIIYAKIEPIDGAGGILGSAGPCLIRSGGTHPALTVVGRMRFDSADVAALEGNGSLNLVIQHEMGHVLGYGTLWEQSPFSLRVGTGGADPYFTGVQANAAFDRVGGVAYVAGPKVPLENTGGSGTRDAHWRESVFDRELMTGFLDAGLNPLSIVSLGSLWDLNYLVNYADADTYAWPAPPALVGSGWTIEMKDDVDRTPILAIDPRTGRVVRVIRQ